MPLNPGNELIIEIHQNHHHKTGRYSSGIAPASPQGSNEFAMGYYGYSQAFAKMLFRW